VIYKKSKFYSIIVAGSVIFSANVANAGDRVQLYLGGKPKLPSIEVNIGAAYKAKKAADIRLAKERKIKARVHKMVEKEQERILETQAEADSQEKIRLQAELRQAAMMAAEERIARQRAEAEARAIREEAEKIRLAKERLETERREAALEKAKKLAQSLSKQRKDAAKRKADEVARIKQATEAIQEVDRSETDIIHTPKAQDKVEVVEVEDISKLPAELPEPDIKKEVEKIEVIEPEEVISEVKIIEPEEEIAISKTKEKRSFFDSLKSIFSTKEGEQDAPKLADVPKLDKSRITITREAGDGLEEEIEEALLSGQEEVEEPVEIIEEIEKKVVEEKAPEPKIVKKEGPVKSPVPLSMVNKIKSKSEPKSIEKKEPVTTKKLEEKKLLKQAKKEDKAEPAPLIIEIPRPEPSGDALSIASMFGASNEDVPMPSVLRKENTQKEVSEEASDSVAAIAEAEDGGLLKPQSLIPSILNNQKSAAGETEKEVRMQVASLPNMVKTTTPGVLVSIEFLADSENLPSAVEEELSKVVLQMKADQSKRLSIIGYASNADDTISTARRISLKRALAVRKHLINNGIESTRINVQAMGNSYKGDGSKDRVDVFFIGEKG
jgi:outer membrane protein OmpA-like peptidoglycan-associated protein